MLRGRLRVVAEDGRTLRILGPGAAIGELALLTGAPRSASVQAVRDSTLLRLPRERFDELMERDAHFAATVARELAVLLQASGGLSAPPARPSLFALGRSARVCRSTRSLARSRTRSGATAPWRSWAPTRPAPARSSAPRTSRRTCCSSTRPGPARGATSARGRPTGCCSSRRASRQRGAPAPNADLVMLGPAEARGRRPAWSTRSRPAPSTGWRPPSRTTPASAVSLAASSVAPSASCSPAAARAASPTSGRSRSSSATGSRSTATAAARWARSSPRWRPPAGSRRRSATAVTRSSSAARRSTTTRSRGSR